MPTIKNLRSGNYTGTRKAYIKQLMAKGVSKRRITEDDPRFDPATMGNKQGHKGRNYYVRGKQVRGPMRD